VAPLPARVAGECLDAAALLPRQQAPPLRALLFLVLSFATLIRASSAVPLAWDDVVLKGAHVMVRPKVIKGGQLKAVLPKPKLLPILDGLRALPQLLNNWKHAQAVAFSAARLTQPPPGAPSSFWLLPGDDVRYDSVVATEWLQQACAHVRARPPMGGKFTSHSCRKGGASAAFAVGVTLPDLCALGDWADGSGVPMKH